MAWEQLTAGAQQVILSARKHAKTRGNPVVTQAHLLLALAEQEHSTACRLIARLGIPPETAAAKARSLLPAPPPPANATAPTEPTLGQRTAAAIEQACVEADHQNCRFVGTEHLLLGLICEREGPVGAFWDAHCILIADARAALNPGLYPASEGGGAPTPPEIPSADLRPADRGIPKSSWYTRDLPISEAEYGERFTGAARNALLYAQGEADQCGSPSLTPEHLLAGVLQEENSAASALLDHIGQHSPDLHRTTIRESLSLLLTVADPQNRKRPFRLDDRSRVVIASAHRTANFLKDAHIGTEHLLLGLLEDPGAAGALLRDAGLTAERLRAALPAIGRGFTGEGAQAKRDPLKTLWRWLLLIAAVVAAMIAAMRDSVPH